MSDDRYMNADMNGIQ